MLKEEHAKELTRLVEQINNDTDIVRLDYIIDELIQLSHDLYPGPALRRQRERLKVA